VPTTPEVIVIGAGIIGCACAHELAHAGLRVSVFDVRRVGQGASQASAGVLAPYIEGHQPGALRELGRRSLDLYDRFVRSAMAESGLSVQYTRSGTLEIAVQVEEADRLIAAANALKAQGVAARWIDPAELHDMEPLAATGAKAGLLIRSHGFVGVPDLADALATSAMRHGATFALETRVISVDVGPGNRVAVETENGVSFADYVVLAAGTWAGQIKIGDAESVPVKPVRGQLLHLSWPTAQPLRHVLWGRDCYIVPWLGGRVLVGATVEDAGFDERPTVAGVRDLLEAGCSLVPHLWQASFAEVRVGLRPLSPDGLPIIGRSMAVPGLVYATGHYRNGVLLAPLTAAIVRDIVLDRNVDAALETLTPMRFGQL
jgi:glycine oxidase